MVLHTTQAIIGEVRFRVIVAGSPKNISESKFWIEFAFRKAILLIRLDGRFELSSDAPTS